MAGHLLDGPLASTTRLDFPHKGPRNLLLGQAQTLVHKALLHNCKDQLTWTLVFGLEPYYRNVVADDHLRY